MHAENSTVVNLVTTAETVVISGAAAPVQYAPPAQPPAPLPHVISGIFNITTGAGTTGLTVRCRGGINTLTGPVIENALPITIGAAASDNIPFEFYDATGRIDGYTITVQQGAATGNGTVNESSMDAIQQ